MEHAQKNKRLTLIQDVVQRNEYVADPILDVVCDMLDQGSTERPSPSDIRSRVKGLDDPVMRSIHSQASLSSQSASESAMSTSDSTNGVSIMPATLGEHHPDSSYVPSFLLFII